MRFSRIIIRNFKSIREMEIDGIENALILVGKNNTGKTSVLDAVQMLTGSYEPSERDFNEKKQNIEVEVELEITQEDLGRLHTLGRVSAYKRYEVWERDFCRRLLSISPSPAITAGRSGSGTDTRRTTGRSRRCCPTCTASTRSGRFSSFRRTCSFSRIRC